MTHVMGAAQDFGRTVHSSTGTEVTVNTTDGVSTAVFKIAGGQGIYVDKRINDGAEPYNNNHSGDDFWDNWGFFTQRHRSLKSAINPLRWPGMLATPLYHCMRRSFAGQSSTFKQIKTTHGQEAEVTYRMNRGIGLAAINLGEYGGSIRVKRGMLMGGELKNNGRAHYVAPDFNWAVGRRLLGMPPPYFRGMRIEGEGIILLAAKDGIIDIEPIEPGHHRNITERKNLFGQTKSVGLRPSWKKWGLDIKATAREKSTMGTNGPGAIIQVTPRKEIGAQTTAVPRQLKAA